MPLANRYAPIFYKIELLDYEHTAYDSGRSVRVVRVTTAEYRSVREHLHVFKGMRWLARPSKEKQQNFVLFLFSLFLLFFLGLAGFT